MGATLIYAQFLPFPSSFSWHKLLLVFQSVVPEFCLRSSAHSVIHTYPPDYLSLLPACNCPKTRTTQYPTSFPQCPEQCLACGRCSIHVEGMVAHLLTMSFSFFLFYFEKKLGLRVMCPYLLLSLVAPSRCLRGSKEGMRTSRKQDCCREPEHVPGGSGP